MKKITTVEGERRRNRAMSRTKAPKKKIGWGAADRKAKSIVSERGKAGESE